MSGASEATLQDLLASNHEQTAALRAIAAKLGPSGPGGGGGGGDPVGKSSSLLGKSASMMGSALNGVASILGGTFKAGAGLAASALSTVAETGKGVWEANKQLAQTAIDGSGKLDTFANSLSQLPGILGMIATAYAYQQKKAQVLSDTYEAITESGAAFSGNLTEMRNAAKGVGLSMSEFATMIKNNGPALVKLGLSADDGAKKLVKFNTDLIKGEVGRGLFGLGYSLQETNDLLGNYATIVGGLNADQMRDQKRMEQSVNTFATELDLSAQLEGKSRKQKEDEMKRASQNAAVQAKLATMTQDQKDKYALAMSNALRTAGQAGADALNSSLLGLPPMTKEAQTLQAVMPEANQAILDNAALVKDGSTLQQSENKIRENGVKGQIAAKDAVGKLGETTAAAISMGGKANALQGTINAGLETKARLDNQGIKTVADGIKQEKDIQAEQEKRKKSENAKLEQDKARAKFQGELMDKLYGAMAKLFPIVEKVFTAFTELFSWASDFGHKVYNNIIAPAFKELFGNIKLDDLIKPFKDFWKGLTGGFTTAGLPNMKEVKDKIVAFLKPIVDAVGGWIKAIDFEEVGKNVRHFLDVIGGFLSGLWDSAKSLPIDEYKAYAKKYFETIKSIYDAFVTALGKVDWEGIMNKVKTSLTSFYGHIKEILIPFFEGASKLFDQIQKDAGPVLDDLMDILGTLGGYLMDLFGFINDHIVPIFKPMAKAIGDALIPLWNVFKDIIGVIKAILHGDFSQAGHLIGDAIENLWEALKDLLKGIWEGITGLAKMGWDALKSAVGLGSDKKPEDAAVKNPTPSNKQQPATQTQTQSATLDKMANDWAWSVYSGKNSLAQVPKDALNKVNDILKNPPSTWKDALKKEQDSTKTKKEEKPVDNTTAKTVEETPVADLNNKDQLSVLKTIADYQRRTIDAVNNLNGNVYRRG